MTHAAGMRVDKAAASALRLAGAGSVRSVRKRRLRDPAGPAKPGAIAGSGSGGRIGGPAWPRRQVAVDAQSTRLDQESAWLDTERIWI